MGFLRIPNSTPIEKTHEVYVRMVLGCPGQEVRINGERINGLYPTGYIEVKFLNGLGFFEWVILRSYPTDPFTFDPNFQPDTSREERHFFPSLKAYQFAPEWGDGWSTIVSNGTSEGPGGQSLRHRTCQVGFRKISTAEAPFTNRCYPPEKTNILACTGTEVRKWLGSVGYEANIHHL